MLNFLVRLCSVPNIITKPVETTALAGAKEKKTRKKVCTTSPIEQHILIVKIVHIDNVKELTTAASAAAAGALVS